MMSDEELIEDFMEMNDHQEFVVKELFIEKDRFYNLIRDLRNAATIVDGGSGLMFSHGRSKLTVRPDIES